MINYYHKTLLTLVACILLLPMVLLVFISTCDFTVADSDSLWHTIVRRTAVTIIVLWFFNLMLLILTVATKELLIGHFCRTFDQDRDSSQDASPSQSHPKTSIELRRGPRME
ncbi:MAG: hypothetical protein FWD31_05585 [Planctomycetaceae bacterium]|nr:hypothetical protein [Planctomycetaceae bacterium]